MEYSLLIVGRFDPSPVLFGTSFHRVECWINSVVQTHEHTHIQHPWSREHLCTDPTVALILNPSFSPLSSLVVTFPPPARLPRQLLMDACWPCVHFAYFYTDNVSHNIDVFEWNSKFKRNMTGKRTTRFIHSISSKV